MQKTNMVRYLDILTVKEKALICYLASHLPSRNFELPKTDFHQGLLPFINTKDVIYWARIGAGIGPTPFSFESNKYKRIALGILSKMHQETEQDVGQDSFLMRLDNKKVYRRFGPHPERGKPLPFLPKETVTVGHKWSLPKKQYVDDTDVLVSPCVTLKKYCIEGYASHLWEVTVSKKCRAAVESWLFENCQ